MTIIKEVVCSKCGRKQIQDLEGLLRTNLFWRPCEFCRQYGLYRTIRQKVTSVSDWLTTLYKAMDLTPIEKFLVSIRKE